MLEDRLRVTILQLLLTVTISSSGASRRDFKILVSLLDLVRQLQLTTSLVLQVSHVQKRPAPIPLRLLGPSNKAQLPLVPFRETNIARRGQLMTMRKW